MVWRPDPAGDLLIAALVVREACRVEVRRGMGMPRVSGSRLDHVVPDTDHVVPDTGSSVFA